MFEQIRDMIAAQLGISAEEINMDSRFHQDLKADSANLMVMIMQLEETFNIEVEDDVILKLTTVGDVVKYIEKNV